MPIAVKGSSALVIKSLKDLPRSVDRAIVTGLARGLLVAVATTQREFLMGPRPQKLDVRTRRLLMSIASEVQIDKTVIPLERGGPGQFNEITAGSGNIIGRMGSNVRYAAYHEFGFKGIVNVAAHTRVITQLSATGQPLDIRRRNNKGEIIESRKHSAIRQKSGAIGFAYVSAHKRNVNYKGRPYLRPALEQCLPTITGEINKELKNLAPA